MSEPDVTTKIDDILRDLEPLSRYESRGGLITRISDLLKEVEKELEEYSKKVVGLMDDVDNADNARIDAENERDELYNAVELINAGFSSGVSEKELGKLISAALK